MVFIGMDHGTTGISFCIMSDDGEVIDVFKIGREESKQGLVSAKKEIYIGISLTTLLIILNFIFKTVPSQILFMALTFSIGLIILSFMSNSMKIFENSSALNTRQKSKIRSFKNTFKINIT